MATTRISDFITIASQLTLISEQDIRSDLRHARINRARFAIYFAVRGVTADGVPRYSTTEIGKAMNRDHSTVVHGVQRAKDMVERDPSFAALVANIIDIAAQSRPFIKDRVAPVKSPYRWDKRPKRHATFSGRVDEDNAHRFHHGIAVGSAKLAQALGVA